MDTITEISKTFIGQSLQPTIEAVDDRHALQTIPEAFEDQEASLILAVRLLPITSIQINTYIVPSSRGRKEDTRGAINFRVA